MACQRPLTDKEIADAVKRHKAAEEAWNEDQKWRTANEARIAEMENAPKREQAKENLKRQIRIGSYTFQSVMDP
jgi:hypothetical protein